MQKRPWGVTFVSSFMIVVGGFSTVIIFVYILDSLRIYGVSSLMITGPMSLAGFILYGIMPVLLFGRRQPVHGAALGPESHRDHYPLGRLFLVFQLEISFDSGAIHAFKSGGLGYFARVARLFLSVVFAVYVGLGAARQLFFKTACQSLLFFRSPLLRSWKFPLIALQR